MRQKKSSAEDRYRHLHARYEALKAGRPEQSGGAPAPSSAEATTSPLKKDGECDEPGAPSAAELAAADEATRQEARQLRLNLGCWQCFVVCLPSPASKAQSSML